MTALFEFGASAVASQLGCSAEMRRLNDGSSGNSAFRGCYCPSKPATRPCCATSRRFAITASNLNPARAKNKTPGARGPRLRTFVPLSVRSCRTNGGRWPGRWAVPPARFNNSLSSGPNAETRRKIGTRLRSQCSPCFDRNPATVFIGLLSNAGCADWASAQTGHAKNQSSLRVLVFP